MNFDNQLGLGSNVVTRSPAQVASSTTWASVAGGSYHSIGLKPDGSLWAWGKNAEGELGLGDTTNRSVPVQVTPGASYIVVAAGAYSSFALKSDGTLWAWGWNGFGNLGLGDTATRKVPAQVTPGTTYKAIATGRYHVLAIKSDGTLWAFGWNSNGQLGIGTTIDQSTPVQVTPGTTYTAVAGGTWHSLAIKSDGTLWAWGGNTDGQLGLGDTTQRTTPVKVVPNGVFTAIAAGYLHSLVIGDILNPAGTLSVPGCTILVGSSNCTTSVSWSVTNPVSPSARQEGTPFSTAASSAGMSRTLVYGTNTFTLYDGTTFLDTKTANALCGGSGIWNGTMCTIPVTCGTANGVPVTTKPTTNLCSDGSTPSVSGSGPWNWACGGNACSAPRAFVCGDGICSASENPLKCPQDCKLKYKQL